MRLRSLSSVFHWLPFGALMGLPLGFAKLLHSAQR
jgi:hypothetical protein